MKKLRIQQRALLGSRRPVLAARLLRRDLDGSIHFHEQAKGAGETAGQVIKAVQRIFGLGADKLTSEEWNKLFAPQTPPTPDRRWVLLVRLVVPPDGDEEGDLRSQFIALPDGTPFSLKLLLIDQRGGGKAGSGHSFNKWPDVARLIPLIEARKSLASGCTVTPMKFAELVKKQAEALGLPHCKLTGKELYQMLQKVKNNGGGDMLPNLDSKGKGRPRTPPIPEESPVDA